MHQLTCTITCLEPVLLATRHGDANMLSTLDHIPGTSLLGLLADRFLTCHQLTSGAVTTHDLFRRCFVSGEVLFGNARITWRDRNNTLYVGRPVPRAIRQAKSGEQLFDLLCLDEAPAEQTKARSGWCHLDEEEIRFQEVATTINFHHSRNPDTGTPRSGDIFNYEAMTAHQTFQGEIRGPRDLLTILADLIPDNWTGYLGRSKNSQYGRIRLTWQSSTPVPCQTPELTGNFPKLTLTLLSDTIVYNESGFATTDAQELARQLGLSGFDRVIMQAGSVETFVSVWGLKKPSEVCFKAGSCFLIRQPGAEICQHLARQQLTGVGVRTHEGFGQFVLNWQTEPELTAIEDAAPALLRPQGPLPAITRNILEQALKHLLQRQVMLLALQELDRFYAQTLPSPSLISRLTLLAARHHRPAFIHQVERLRRSARYQLEHCHNGDQNLFAFLTSSRDLLPTVRKQSGFPFQEAAGLSDLLGTSFDNDAQWAQMLWSHYTHTFFTAMRRLKRIAATRPEGDPHAN